MYRLILNEITQRHSLILHVRDTRYKIQDTAIALFQEYSEHGIHDAFAKIESINTTYRVALRDKRLTIVSFFLR